MTEEQISNDPFIDKIAGFPMMVTKRTPIYVCFFKEGEIIGYTVTAEHACRWASRVNGDVQIKIIYPQSPI
jgi:hypothetical protein